MELAIIIYIIIILIVIFKKYFWGTVIVLIILYNLLKSVIEGIKNIKEHNRYMKILRDIIPKIKNIDLELYKNRLKELEKKHEMSIINLKDASGNSINICPKCGNYIRIVKGKSLVLRRDPFLGCTNYPNCKFTRVYSEIFKIRI